VVPPSSGRIARVPPYSRTEDRLTHTGLSPTMAALSRAFWLPHFSHWPGPRSLATTNGVSVDVLSSGYLDVSVPRVRLPHLWIQCGMTLAGRVSPFGYRRIKACSQLPDAFRSVPRPSSPLGAKASTECPYRARYAHARTQIQTRPKAQSPKPFAAPVSALSHAIRSPYDGSEVPVAQAKPSQPEP
jgi:hypothetical protein